MGCVFACILQKILIDHISMKNNIDPIFSFEETRFNRLTLDQLKEQDLKILFQTLMTEPCHRTIADVNGLIKIMLTLQPIKKVHNSSIIYHLCRSMFIAKFKEKSFVYQKQEEAESLYIILSGKVGLYKRTPDVDDQEEVIFLSEGSSFGYAYRWKQKFLPLTFEETLLAVVPRRELSKIAYKVSKEKQEMIRVLAKAKIFGSIDKIRENSESLTLHRVSFGSSLIKEGEIPKGIFFILKGTVSKHLQMRKEQDGIVIDKKQLAVSEYSAGDYFPKEALSECLPFTIIADSPCQIVCLPKRSLKALGWPIQSQQTFKGEEYYQSELLKQRQWQSFKEEYISANLHFRSSQPKPMIF